MATAEQKANLYVRAFMALANAFGRVIEASIINKQGQVEVRANCGDGAGTRTQVFFDDKKN